MIKQSFTIRAALVALVILMLPVSIIAGGQGEQGDDTVQLEFWMPGQEPTIRDTMQALIDQYESENPGVSVTYTQSPWNEWFTKLSAAIAGNLVPDVSGLGFGQFGMLVTKDTFAPIPEDPKFALADVEAWALNAGKYNGQLYALFMPETRPLVYRKDFFQEAGLDPNSPPKNIEELVEYAKKLTKYENGKVVRAGMDIPYIGSGEQIFLSFYALMKKGGHLWEEGGRAALNDPKGVETLQFLVDMNNKHKVILPSDLQALQGNAFESGNAAMGFAKSQGLPALLKSKPGQLGFAVPPKGETQAALTLGTFLAPYKKSKNPEAALDFLAYMYSADSMWKIYQNILFLPTRKSLKSQFLADQEYNQVLYECTQNSVSFNVNPKFGEARKIVAEEIEAAFYEAKTPAEALAEAEKRLNDLID